MREALITWNSPLESTAAFEDFLDFFLVGEAESVCDFRFWEGDMGWRESTKIWKFSRASRLQRVF